MTQTRRLGLAGILGLIAASTSCSSSDDTATSADNGIGDGEMAGPRSETNSSAPPGAPAGVAYDSSVSAEAPALGLSDPGSGASGGETSAGAALSPPDSDGVALEPAPSVPRPEQLAPGTLTVGAWDDNRNLERFLSYRDELHRGQLAGLLDFTPQAHELAHEAQAELRPHTTLDVSLVIDTTGSMGDELRYLQTEFLALSASIEAKYPDAEQRWSLVVYKDQGDEYISRWFDFREDPQEFRDNLAAQSAGGGGDIPEAPEAAFEAMNQLAWRSGDATAKLAFWVADAPHHTERAPRMKAAIEAAESQGVHIYPVASSGIDEPTELLMRSAAQLTGGRYLFLTDDSGVGGAHKEPSIPCYFVTKLDVAILRMVDIEMTGEYREPRGEDVLRAGGDPQNGACLLESGQSVFVF